MTRKYFWVAAVIFAAGLALTMSSCKDAKKEALAFKKCGRRKGRCTKPNVCIKTGRFSAVGICVHPCQADGDCPKPFRCTGRWSFTGVGKANKKFCRGANVGLGGSCKRIRDGCKKGLRCFNFKCVKTCKKEPDCQKGTRCVQIHDKWDVGRVKKTLYRACLRATKPEGSSCSLSKQPFCQKGLACFRSKCVRECANNKHCKSGTACIGMAYVGPGAVSRKMKKARPDFMYCIKTHAPAAVGGRCDGGKRPCKEGLACIANRCREVKKVAAGKKCDERRGTFCEKGSVCYGWRCRPFCETDKDCPKMRRRGRPRCKKRLYRGKSVKLCF